MKTSICVRVKYPVDRLHALILSLQRQTHTNWEAVVTTDGPNPAAAALVAGLKEPRLVLVETPEPKGCWGHPYRNLAISRCTGELIGLTNDDNYYVPGYLATMTQALIENNAQMVMCDMVHKDFEWGILETRPERNACDLGNWIVLSRIAKTTPWPGNSSTDDGKYVELMAAKCERIAIVKRPLFVKN